MKFKRFVLIISVLCFSISATGCGEALYTMTDEEETIISLYAAKMVSKFNKNQTNGICNARIKEGELDGAYSSAPEIDEILPEDSIDDTGLVYDPETGELIEQGPEATEVQGGYSFTDAIAVENVSFNCASFEVAKEYKATSSFILTEVKGKSYVVLKIDATNNSDEEVVFDNDLSFKLSVNGSSYSSTQNTFLSNDLSTYNGSVGAGDTKKFVLVFQFSDSEIEDITSLSLQVTNDGTTREANI